MSVQRIHRLLRLITQLQSNQAQSAADLVASLGVSRRTLFRDLKMLQAAGIPCYHQSGVGYRIARSFFLPPISLTVPETLGLMLLGKSTVAQPNRPLLSAALSAVSKLITTMPDPIRSACADLMANVSIDPGAQAVSPREVEHYPTLQRCIDERRVCHVVYQGPMATEAFDCLLEPYALHFATRAWYVLGRTDVHDQVRVLKLSRIQTLEPLQRTFSRPRRFDVSDKLGNAWQLIPEGRQYDVEVLFSPLVAANVTEVRWHSSQQYTMRDDGSCLMRFRVDGLGEIAWWLCGYADQVVVHKPAALRRRVQRMLRAAADQYDDHQAPPAQDKSRRRSR